MWRFKSSKYKNANPKVKKATQVFSPPIVGPCSSNAVITASAALVASTLESCGKIALLQHVEEKVGDAHLVNAHSDDILDLTFSPFHDDLLASCDGSSQVKLWHWPETSNPVVELPCPAERLAFHPSCDRILASSKTDQLALWDISAGGGDSAPLFSLPRDSSSKASTGLQWRADGSLLLWASEGGHLTFLDPRQTSPIYQGSLNPAFTSTNCQWLSPPDSPFFLLSGVTQRKQTQVLLYDLRNLDAPLSDISGPISFSAPLILFDPDTDMLFTATKGEPGLLLHEINPSKEPHTSAGATFQSTQAIRAMALVPKRGLSLMEAEVNRILTLTTAAITPVSYIVPRKTYSSYHADLYPDTLGTTSNLTLEDWKSGKDNVRPTMALSPDLSLVSLSKPGRLFTEDREEEPADDPCKNAGEGENGTLPTQEPDNNNHQKLSEQEDKKDKALNGSHASNGNVEQAESQLSNPPAKEKPSGFVLKTQPAKCRHITGKPAPKPSHITHIKNISTNIGVTGESPGFAANEERAAFQLNLPGGHLAVIELEPGRRLTDPPYPSFLCGTNVTDFCWDPFDNRRLLAGCANGDLLICMVPLVNEGPLLPDTAPTVRFRGPPGRVSMVRFHPTAADVATTTYTDRTIVIWDLTNFRPKLEISGSFHSDALWSLAWSPDGCSLATLCKDRQLRLFKPQQGPELVNSWAVEGLGGRGARICWVLGGSHVAIAGFTSLHQKQVILVDSRQAGAAPLVRLMLDVTHSMPSPFYDEDTRTLFISSKGDNTMDTLEVRETELVPLTPFACPNPPLAVAFLPKIICNVAQVEIAKAVCLTSTSLEPLSFYIPRQRADYFQDDLFPPTRVTWTPLVTAEQWFSGVSGEPQFLNLQPPDMEPVSLAKPLVPAPKAPEPELVLEKRFEGSMPDSSAIEKRDQLLQAIIDKLEYLPDEPQAEETEGWDDNEDGSAA